MVVVNIGLAAVNILMRRRMNVSYGEKRDLKHCHIFAGPIHLMRKTNPVFQKKTVVFTGRRKNEVRRKSNSRE